jgi:protein involved in temperature-dependent protein secretion
MELAQSLARLMALHNYSHTELAKVIGKPRSTISELLSLNKLPDAIQLACQSTDMPNTDVLTRTFLVELSKFSEADQLRAWAAFTDGHLSTVQAMRDLLGKKTKKNVSTDTEGWAIGASASGMLPLAKKPKRVFHTAFEATIIVQADGDVLTDSQVEQALREAADRAVV